MNFRQRFLRYGIGVFIGVILSAVFFSGRSCNDWLPEKRIKARIQLDGVVPDFRLQCLLDCEGPTRGSHSSWMAWLLAADINWSESTPRETPPCYRLDMAADCPFESMTVCFTEGSGTLGDAVVREATAEGACDCPSVRGE